MSHLYRLFHESASAARSVNYRHVCLILLVLFASARFSATGVKARSAHPVLISLNSAGTGTGNRSSGDSGDYRISADGRYIVYSSDASDLVPNDMNGWTDVFVRDMMTDTTRLVSVATTGMSGNNSSSTGLISDDGRYIFFSSAATNLTMTPDTNSQADYFVRDTQAGTTTLISINKAGTASGRNTQNPNGFFPSLAVTPDGRYVRG